MCGVVGLFAFHGAAPIDPALWRPSVARMWRRGPDGGGSWCNGKALLGCRRLAIMDPGSGAALPMASPDGRFVIAFNGELYDHAEHRAHLARRGWTFRTSGDTEVVLAALATYGEAALPGFNGMFALAFYDAHDHALLLARDHAGIKPLYVHEGASGVAFCSELDTLLASPAAPQPIIDAIAVGQYLRLGHVPPPRTLVRGVEMLQCGEWRRYGGAAARKCGRDDVFADPVTRLTEHEADDAVAAALTAAVHRQSRCDVPAGVLLSGGIDSPLLAACAAEAPVGPTRAFTVSYDDQAADESAIAADHARALGMDHRFTRLSATLAADLFAEAVAAAHEPLGDEGLLPTLLVSRLARETVVVALAGDGADELFLGYAHRHPAAPWDTDRATFQRRYLQAYEEFTPAYLAACFPGLDATPPPAGLVDVGTAGGEARDWIRQAEWAAYLPFVLLKTDRASMFHSLEVRVPFLDKQVIRTALALPPGALMDPARSLGKLPLRRLLARRRGTAPLRKRGFTAPVEAWLRGPLRAATETTLARLRGLGPVSVSRPALRRLADRHFDGTEDNGMALWRLVMLDHWAARTGL